VSNAQLMGRVVSVKPRGDGSFGVFMVLSDVDRSYGWMISRSAPRLGALFDLSAMVRKRQRRSDADISVFEGGSIKLVEEQWARRFVPHPWLECVVRASGIRLYPHQTEGAGWLAQRLSEGRGAILADDQGLGKTMQVCAALLAARALPAIVVCPASLKRNWERELQNLRVQLVSEVLDGYEGRIPPCHVVITNYDLLKQRERQLSMLGARAIVFDEGHVLKEPSPHDGHRAAVATRLARRIGRAVIMSGTPLPNKVDELWRLLHLVDPVEWPEFDSFRERYCRDQRDELNAGRVLVTEYGRVHNLDELQARMAPTMLRRLKAHVLKDLPAKQRRTITVRLSERDQQVYDNIERDVVAWLRQLGRAGQAERAKQGQAFAKIRFLRRVAALAKLRQAVPEYLHHWFSQGRERRGLVIFGFHRDVLAKVKALCTRMGIEYASITGKDADDKRQAAVDAFNAGQVDAFIAPIRAAGVGLNLQHGGSDVLFLERLWVPASMAQAEDRVHRLGQTKQVTITYLDAKDTIDEHIGRVLAAKQRIIDAVVDDRDRPDEEALERQSFEELVGSMRGAA